MTPQEKAKELVDKFNPLSRKIINDFDTKIPEYKGKECALIAVDEIIDALDESLIHADIEWWKEVKQEIEKL